MSEVPALTTAMLVAASGGSESLWLMAEAASWRRAAGVLSRTLS